MNAVVALKRVPDPSVDTLRDHVAKYVAEVLTACRGNRSQACRVLGISYHTLRNHLARATALHASEAA